MRHGVPRPKTPKVPMYRRPVSREETVPAPPPPRAVVPPFSKPRPRLARPTSVPLNPRAVETVPCRYVVRLTLEKDGEWGWALPDGTRVDGCKDGDVFFVRQHEPSEACYCGWTNCDGMHLHAVCPGGHWWNIDSRAGNCFAFTKC